MKGVWKYLTFLLVFILILSAVLYFETINKGKNNSSTGSDSLVNANQTTNAQDNSFTNSDWIKNGGTFLTGSSLFTWDHMPISFNITSDCGNYEGNRIRRATNIIANDTDYAVNFTEVNGSADISVMCNRNYVAGSTSGTFESGNALPIFADNKIVSAVINFNKVNELSHNYPGGCLIYPDTEIHELLHTLGFGHTTKAKSIMTAIGGGCPTLDKDILDVLKQAY